MSRMSVSSDARGNAVDGAGKNIADADGANGVDGAGRFGRGFKRKNQLGCRGQRVFAAGHQLAAGVTAFAFNEDAQAGRRGNVRDQADIDAFLLEQRALLNVQLDELVEAARGHGDGFKRAVNPACVRSSSRLRPSLSRRASGLLRSEHVAIMRLPRQPMPKRVGSSAVKITSSMERRGLNPSCCRTRMASRPPSTPTHPS